MNQMNTATINVARVVNRVVCKKTRKAYPYVVVSVSPDGVELEIGQFKFAGDAHSSALAMADRPYPAGDWLLVVRNAK